MNIVHVPVTEWTPELLRDDWNREHEYAVLCWYRVLLGFFTFIMLYAIVTAHSYEIPIIVENLWPALSIFGFFALLVGLLDIIRTLARYRRRIQLKALHDVDSIIRDQLAHGNRDIVNLLRRHKQIFDKLPTRFRHEDLFGYTVDLDNPSVDGIPLDQPVILH